MYNRKQLAFLFFYRKHNIATGYTCKSADIKDYEYASDIVDEEYSYVPVSVSQVNTPVSNIEASITTTNENVNEMNTDLHVIDEEDQRKSGNEYDDLPF